MLEFLKSKRIAIVGLGVNNRKLADFLSNHNFKYSVFRDWNTPEDLTGKLEKFDVIFRTPGLPFLSFPVQEAIAQGVQVLSQTKLFLKICPCPIIGVTGTKGKGTTSSLIAKILETSGKKACPPDWPSGVGRRVWLAGNIGKDPFEFIQNISKNDLVVLELSSFQIEDLDLSPQIAVVLNITPDHLNYHKTFKAYKSAKLSILKFQNSNDFAVLHPKLSNDFKTAGFGKKIIFDSNQVADWSRKLLGVHNLENISAAAAVGRILNISEEDVKNVVANFEPLPHRLNVIRELAGVIFVDDSFSTNIDPTLAAVDSFEKPIILCVGGSDKGLDFKIFGEKIIKSKKVKALVVFGQVADNILSSLKNYKGKILSGSKNMPEIVSQARSVAEKGDLILFSPATASFDMFKNEADRGEQFVKVVNSL